jgi:hypothetical protein
VSVFKRLDAPDQASTSAIELSKAAFKQQRNIQFLRLGMRHNAFRQAAASLCKLIAIAVKAIGEESLPA